MQVRFLLGAPRQTRFTVFESEASLTRPLNKAKKSEVRLRREMKHRFCYVYALFSQMDKQLYIGFTKDLLQRINQHQKGLVRSTKNRLPLSLIYYEAYRNISDARAREKYLKSGFGRSQLKKALSAELNKLGYKHLSSNI